MSKLSCTLSACHLQEISYLDILRLVHTSTPRFGHCDHAPLATNTTHYPCNWPSQGLLHHGAADDATGQQLGICVEHVLCTTENPVTTLIDRTDQTKYLVSGNLTDPLFYRIFCYPITKGQGGAVVT